METHCQVVEFYTLDRNSMYCSSIQGLGDPGFQEIPVAFKQELMGPE